MKFLFHFTVLVIMVMTSQAHAVMGKQLSQAEVQRYVLGKRLVIPTGGTMVFSSGSFSFYNSQGKKTHGPYPSSVTAAGQIKGYGKEYTFYCQPDGKIHIKNESNVPSNTGVAC